MVRPVRWWMTVMSRSNLPEQTRTNAMRSRCFGSMLAWILKTNAENLSWVTGISRSRSAHAGSAGSAARAVTGPAAGVARAARSPAKEAVQQELDAEVVHGAAEVDGRLLAGADGGEIEGMAGAVEHRELLGDLGRRCSRRVSRARPGPRARHVDGRGIFRPGVRSKRCTSRVRRSNTPRKSGPLPSGQMTGDDCSPRTVSSSSSSSSALRVGRSHLFMKVKIGTPRRRQTSKSLRVCASMPLAASITMTRRRRR
jgi:hypothetical protein